MFSSFTFSISSMFSVSCFHDNQNCPKEMATQDRPFCFHHSILKWNHHSITALRPKQVYVFCETGFSLLLVFLGSNCFLSNSIMKLYLYQTNLGDWTSLYILITLTTSTKYLFQWPDERMPLGIILVKPETWRVTQVTARSRISTA